MFFTHQVKNVRVAAPEVGATLLLSVALDDVGDSRVTDVSNSEGDSAVGGATKIVCDTDDRPVILNSPEVGVLAVGESSVVDKLSADADV